MMANAHFALIYIAIYSYVSRVAISEDNICDSFKREKRINW